MCPEGSPGTEVGRLGSALNEMLAQIEGAFAEKSASEERLRQFVADASHELRTPLTSIRGYAELLGRGGFSDEAGRHKALKRIEEEATRMGGLVEDLLLLAELDRGRPLRAEPVDLHRICADAVGDSNAVPHDHQLTLEPGPPVVVVGDGERLAQVAHNLVRNALAHTPPGHRGDGVDRRGPDDGLHPGVRQRARDPARRGRPGLRPLLPGRPSRSAAGTGLGLAIVRAIAEALHGTAEVATSPAGGATIVVKIPLAATACRRGQSRRPRRPCAHRSCTEAPGTTASSTVASLTLVSAASASGSESATMPPAGPQREGRPRRRRAGRCGCRSSTPRRRRRRPNPPGRPSGPARPPRGRR